MKISSCYEVFYAANETNSRYNLLTSTSLAGKQKRMAKLNLQIDIESTECATIVIPRGDVDFSRSNELRNILHPILKSQPQRIVVDLAGVSYMDSSGVATLIEALQLAKHADIFFVLCSLTVGVKSIIELTKLDQLFTICDSREDALGL